MPAPTHSTAPPAGETLASGQRGTPFRLQVRKDSGATTTLTYANFSEAYVAKPASRASSWRATAELEQPKRLVDYSQLELTQDDGKRAELGAQLGNIAVLLEQRLGGAQDVEGCVAGGVVYIVQSRPQP
jgi:phosphoglucan,water dikinase